jgi:hypothetical protein
VLSLTDGVLQNSGSSTTPEPIRVDEPKANEGKGHELYLLDFFHLLKYPIAPIKES